MSIGTRIIGPGLRGNERLVWVAKGYCDPVLVEHSRRLRSAEWKGLLRKTLSRLKAGSHGFTRLKVIELANPSDAGGFVAEQDSERF